MSEQVRDHHAASRAVAYLMLAASPFVFATGVILDPPPDWPSRTAVIVTCIAVALGGAVCRFRPDLMPVAFLVSAPILAALLITGMNVVTSDATTGAQLFYLWPAFYAANFLTRRLIYLTLLFVFAGEGLTVGTALGFDEAAADWAAMTLALSMTVFVVVSLRGRADQLLRELERQARTDPLTGLANRRAFDNELHQAGAWAATTSGRLALIAIDLDHFKAINDTWGHAVGDRALQVVAHAMRSVAGSAGVAARLGGDEFVLLLRADRPDAVRAADAVRSAVAATTDLPCGPPGLSIGIALFPDEVDGIDELKAAADRALYEAKSLGRGQVSIADGGRPHRSGFR